MNGPDAALLAAVRGQFHGALPARLGVAVSGGGDSIALLHILSRCFRSDEVELIAASVDHGLRPDAAAEAALAGDLADRLGVAHTVLRWDGWDGLGNLQDRARRARLDLLTDWAHRQGAGMLALGHTADDQAETVLMRLARASGVGGLAGIAPRRVQDGITLVRPLLDQTRAALRAYLSRNDIVWADDPSNDDDRFDRVRARRALEVLAPLGVTVQALAEVAQNMAQARDALDWHGFLAARDTVDFDAGDLMLDLRRFRILPQEIARRVLTRAILWVGGGDYGPRRAPLADVIDALRRGHVATTLGGCLIRTEGPRSARICREFAAVRGLRCAPNEVWDRRWRLSGGDATGCEVRALGNRGVSDCADWRATGRPREALAATPAVWRAGDLVAAPLAGLANGWRVDLDGSREDFFASFLSH